MRDSSDQPGSGDAGSFRTQRIAFIAFVVGVVQHGQHVVEKVLDGQIKAFQVAAGRPATGWGRHCAPLPSVPRTSSLSQQGTQYTPLFHLVEVPEESCNKWRR